MNLMKADFFHLRKDKVFWILLLIVIAMPFATCIMVNYMSNGFGINAENIIMQGIGADIICAILGIGISSFVGRDYTNHTIRNKLCYGEKRHKIMFVNFLMSLLITVIFIAASLVSALLSSALFGEIVISSAFWGKYLCQIAILLSFSMLITAVVICAKSEKAGFLVTVILSVLLTAVSYLLPMLAAISDVARAICRCLYMIVSTMLVSSTEGIYVATSGATFDHMYLNAVILSLVYAVVSIAITTVVVRKQSYK